MSSHMASLVACPSCHHNVEFTSDGPQELPCPCGETVHAPQRTVAVPVELLRRMIGYAWKWRDWLKVLEGNSGTQDTLKVAAAAVEAERLLSD